MLTGRRFFLGTVAAGVTAGLVAKPATPRGISAQWADQWKNGAITGLRKGDTITFSGTFVDNRIAGKTFTLTDSFPS